jgi:hypothetical protein
MKQMAKSGDFNDPIFSLFVLFFNNVWLNINNNTSIVELLAFGHCELARLSGA